MTGALKQSPFPGYAVIGSNCRSLPGIGPSEHVALSDPLSGLALIPFSKALLKSLRVQFPSDQQALYHDSRHVALSEKLVGRALNQNGRSSTRETGSSPATPAFLKDCTSLRSNICQPFIRHAAGIRCKRLKSA